MRGEKKKWCAKTKVVIRATSKQGFNARQNNSVLVNASVDFVEPLIFTNIKVIVTGLFYERDCKAFTDFRLFSILCSCTTCCSKGTCSWSSDKLTVFHEER